jgi:hypothetical protein
LAVFSAIEIQFETEKKHSPFEIPQLSIDQSSAIASQYMLGRIDIEQQIIPEDYG